MGPPPYAMFPVTEDLDKIVMYAKIGGHWDMLASDTPLEISRVCRAPSTRNRIEESVFVWVVRTKEGRLRRLNDYLKTRPRKKA